MARPDWRFSTAGAGLCEFPIIDDRNGGHRHADVQHCNDRQREHDAPRHRAARLLHLLGDIEHVLESDEREKSKHRTPEQHLYAQAMVDESPLGIERCPGRLQIVDASPIARADRDDQNQTAYFDGRADEIRPHRFANAPKVDERHSAQKQQGHQRPRPAEHVLQRFGEDACLRGHRREPRGGHRQPDQIR